MIRKFITVIATCGGIFLIGAAVMALLVANKPRNHEKPEEIAPPSVFVQTVKSAPVRLKVHATGEVRPVNEIELTAQVSGKIVKASKAFRNGGAFDKGELLVKIEDSDYRFAVTRAEARVAQTAEALNREQAESALALKDWTDLGNPANAASPLTLRKPQLAQAKADHDAAVADLDIAKLNLARTSVRAPFTGRVRTRSVGEGQYINVGSQLASVFSTEAAEVRLPLTDANFGRLALPLAYTETAAHSGPDVTLSAMVGGTERHWRGRIVRTDGAIDPGTRQISVFAHVDDPYGAGADNGAPLAVGLFVDAEIVGEELPSAIVAPRIAVHGENTAYVVDADNVVHERTLTIADSGNDDVIVTAGLSDGERIVVSPLRGARDGDKVTPIDKAEQDQKRPESVGATTEARATPDATNQ